MTEYALRLANSQDTAPRVRVGDALPLVPNGPLTARSGVRGNGGVVTVVAGTMQVQVASFAAWVDGGTSDAQGGYPVVLDAAKTLAIADGHATLSRVDVIGARVRESAFDGSGSTDAQVIVVQGVPGAGTPALPTTFLPLRSITVPPGTSAGTGGLSAGMLGPDMRSFLSSGVLPVASAAERGALSGLSEGQVVYRTDTDRLEAWDGSAWRTYVPSGVAGGSLTTTGISSGGVSWRAGGGMVEVDINATTLSSSLAAGSTVAVVTAANGIPAAYRPAGTAYAAVFSGSVVGFGRVNSDGSIEVRASTGTLPAAFGTIVWTV